MGIIDVAQNAAGTMKQLAGTSVNQISNRMSNNVEAQKALRGVSSDIDVSSGISNPLVAHEEEKYQIKSDIDDRHRGTWRKHIDRTVVSHLTPGLVQLTLHGGFIDAVKTLLGTSGQVAAQLVKLGELKSAGWKLTRLTEMSALICKQHAVSAESSIRHEAPVITQAAVVHSVEAHHHSTVADLKSVVVKDEIHRVADAFGLDAKYLTLLLQATAKLQANQSIEIAAGTTFSASALTSAELVGGTSVKLSSPIVTVVGGIINLNPVTTIATVPTVVLPVVGVTADSWPHATTLRSQYEGTLAHGTNLI